jgi:DNA-binding MarR family transcriptional regulator
VAVVRVLEVLLRKGPLPVNTIGPKVWLTPGSISVAVDRLVKKGLVSRKDRAADRRVRQVELTAKGQALITRGVSGARRSHRNCGQRPFKKGAADIDAAFEKTGKARGRNSQIKITRIQRHRFAMLEQTTTSEVDPLRREVKNVRAFSVNRISGCKQLVAQIARQTTRALNRLLAGATQDIQSNPSRLGGVGLHSRL